MAGETPQLPCLIPVQQLVDVGHDFHFDSTEPSVIDYLQEDLRAQCPSLPQHEQHACARVLLWFIRHQYAWLRAAKQCVNGVMAGSLFEAFCKSALKLDLGQELAAETLAKVTHFRDMLLKCMLPRLELIHTHAPAEDMPVVWRGTTFATQLGMDAYAAHLKSGVGVELESATIDVHAAIRFATPGQMHNVMAFRLAKAGRQDLVASAYGLCTVYLGFQAVPFFTWSGAPRNGESEVWLSRGIGAVLGPTASTARIRELLRDAVDGETLELLAKTVAEHQGLLSLCVVQKQAPSLKRPLSSRETSDTAAPANARERRERPPRVCLAQGLQRETKSRAKRPRDAPSRPSTYWGLFRPLTAAELGEAEPTAAAAGPQPFDEAIEINFDTNDGAAADEGAVDEAQRDDQQDGLDNLVGEDAPAAAAIGGGRYGQWRGSQKARRVPVGEEAEPDLQSADAVPGFDLTLLPFLDVSDGDIPQDYLEGVQHLRSDLSSRRQLRPYSALIPYSVRKVSKNTSRAAVGFRTPNVVKQ